MRAILWKDWTLLRKSRLYMAFAVGMWLFVPIVVAVLAVGSPQDAATADGAWSFGEALAGWYGYVASILAFGTLFSNSATMDFSAVPRSDGTLENWRGSGRPMLPYCVAKSLLPVIIAEFMTLTNVGYLVWAGLDASTNVMQVTYVVASPALLAFAAEQLYLALHAGSMGSLSLATILTSAPMLVFTVLTFTVSRLWSLVVLLVFGLAVMGATVVSCRRRYPTVLRAIG
ncbi:hypothetical protein [Bifidobacterium miconisargentati]|uniref:hypothetical protein n=1 Tax=Bifidobacterium miconisargentati TaxID=2834437 RepID=UPI001BDDAA7F|nr:hypothetical protein [Bifidobacterium miconisargentati]MBW3090719.1 hypothetical protein [Bifidobacterium miconisargentati]